jgi:hypothetical protein
MIFLSGISFSSCGPNTEEQKKMRELAQTTFDSINKEADKAIKENLRRADSIRNANNTITPTPTPTKNK